jgi:hypothetical protein
MKKPDLPEFLMKPGALLWAFILPQTALLMINLHAWWLVGGEGHGLSWLAVSVYEVVLIGLAAVLGWFSLAHGSRVPASASAGLMLVNVIYFFIYLNLAQKLVPWSLDRWIINQEDLIVSQATFMMPGIFYGVTRLACARFTIDKERLPVFIIGAILLLPLLLLGTALFAGNIFTPWSLVPYFTFTAFVLFFMYVFISRVLEAYQSLAVKGALENSILRILLAASGPALVSLLNKVFHLWTGAEGIVLFILVSLNAVVMILPPCRKPELKGWGLFLRSVTFPVSFYFFLFVLPYLPIGVLAILLLGFGFLVWIPVVIFLVHMKALAEDWKAAVSSLGLRKSAMFLGAGLLALPLFFGVQAVKDKIVLKKAVQFVYSSEARGDLTFDGSAQDVARTMRALQQFKEGDGFPYLSDMYNAIVFEGMVLSDEKIRHMYRLFSGEDLPRIYGGSLWGRRSSRRNFTPGSAPDERDVNIVSENMATLSPLPGMRQSTLSLSVAWPEKKDQKDIKEPRSWQDGRPREFYQVIDLPPGVLISGFRLKVGEDMVPGRIFEKKTALWVYEQIKNTRKDPGLLVYQSPTRVELKVFPVEAHETRQVEIDFLYPDHFYPSIKLNDREVAILTPVAGVSPAGVIGASLMALPEGVIRQLPAMERKPYYHFIVDRSLQASLPLETYGELIRKLAVKNPEITKVKFTAANFETQSLTPRSVGLNDAGQWQKALERMSLPLQGSLDLQRVLQSELLAYKEQCLDQVDSGCWQEYPFFIVLTGAPQNVLPFSERLDPLRRYVPEVNKYYIVSLQKGDEPRLLWGASEKATSAKVVLLRQGQHMAVVSSQARGYYDQVEGARVEVFDPATGVFKSLDDLRPLGDNPVYEQGLKLMRRNEAAWISLRLMDKDKRWLVEQSRQLGILAPATAYMVVERDAQFRGLEDKEREKMRASDAFDLGENVEPQNAVNSPAPSWLLFFVAMVFWLGLKRWRLRVSRCD